MDPQGDDDLAGIISPFYLKLFCSTSLQSDTGILSYAEYMGMIPIDEDLLWIARDGYNAPLPDGWTEEFPHAFFSPVYHQYSC
jgi:hypothetical protein